MNTYKIKISGIVQGVGFRPFIYKLALSKNLCGYVNNDDDGVNIEINANENTLQTFINDIKLQAPPLSNITNIEVIEIENSIYKSFEITKSIESGHKTTIISPDIAICDDCKQELMDIKDRRFKYPLINCTNCGPRYTIIDTLPYDRKNTSMSKFSMCKACENEYTNPLDRRFHAQPISCFECGPKLSFYSNKLEKIDCDDIIDLCANKINEGKIVAIKGMGGFHLICDATNSKAIEVLRMRKNRAKKPFAIMFEDIEQIKKCANVSMEEEKLILSKEKPIVVLKKKQNDFLSELIAPDIDRIGVFVAYTPLHILLLDKLKKPIVATSANLSEEPIIRSAKELSQKLSNVVDYILDFDREIINANDDSVSAVVNGESIFYRLSRGYTPKLIKLKNKSSKKILSVGGNQKVTISLIYEDNLIVSPHIGDLNSFISFEYFTRTIDSFKRFYDFEPDLIVCDKHPNYESSKYAREYAKEKNIELLEVSHHYAHALSTIAEYEQEIGSKKILSFSFDGTGYGDDGNIWGGEVLRVNNKGYEREYHFEYFRLLGANKAIKEPKRVALSFLFDNYTLNEMKQMQIPTIKAFSEFELNNYHKMWEKGLNSPLTSSVGRIFDAVYSLGGFGQILSYEGESGLVIEKYYDVNITQAFNYEIKNKKIILEKMVKEIIELKDKTIIASKFINMLCNIICELSKDEKEIILCGGVFQNITLLNQVIKKSKSKVFYHKKLPINDGSISVGQAYYGYKSIN